MYVFFFVKISKALEYLAVVAKLGVCGVLADYLYVTIACDRPPAYELNFIQF